MTNKGIATIQTESCCGTPSRGPTLERSQAHAASELFAALADPTRLAILNMLASADTGEVCVCDITDSFDLGQPTISHHLRLLREAGLVRGDKRGKWVYYSLVETKAAEVSKLLEVVFNT